MIIPVRCFTCGKLLAGKWRKYEDMCREFESHQGQDTVNLTVFGTSSNDNRGSILDDLGLKKICCRRHMLTHVDLVDMI
jgi:DNA-directed RNA polymerase subunit N (RpoN/RPB10)